ncbi:hypothetical protein [Risungbinella massiliensis]|uniref:hypothetical protein n=1 Tax=Risungbinella massiliensis TaxID=1329796 RepID=UPI0005CBC3E1|nr:hypothetical protein [Risungbinella massiliensis]
MNHPVMIASLGAGIFTLGFGLLIQKVQVARESKKPVKSYLTYYLSSLLLMAIGAFLFLTGLELEAQFN